MRGDGSADRLEKALEKGMIMERNQDSTDSAASGLPLNRWGWKAFKAVFWGPEVPPRLQELELKAKAIGDTLEGIEGQAAGLAQFAGEADEGRVAGLAQKRIGDLKDLVELATEERDVVRKTNPWLRLGGGILTGLLLVATVGSFVRFGHDAESLSSTVDWVQTLSGIFTMLAVLFGWGYFLFRFDRRRRRDLCLKRIATCRSYIQIIDSHLLSKHFGPYWEVPSCRDRVGGASERDKIYQTPRLAIQYLNLSAQLVRCCARVAALYAEWLSEESDVAQQSETLLQLALDIERNTLLKAELISRATPEGTYASPGSV